MQCPSCGFQNLPGLSACARCSGMLSLAGIDVEPYRRSRHWVRWRHWQWRRRNAPPLINRFFDYLRSEWERAGLSTRTRGPDEPTQGERLKWIGASIVPGLGHLLVGDKRRGWLLLACFSLALVGSILFMSSAWTMCMAVMLGVHTYALVDATLRRSPFVPWQPMLTSLMVLPLLMYGLYQPCGWLLAGVAQLEPLDGHVESSVLQDGDVLLVPGRWFGNRRYQPGEVVSYNLPDRSGSGWYTRAGVSIDRILAGPGDKVSFRDQQIRVNGRLLPSTAIPLGRIQLPSQYDVVVPPGAYFILPSLARLGGHFGPNGEIIQTEVVMSVSIVPLDEIRGRVIAVVNPLNRVRRF